MATTKPKAAQIAFVPGGGIAATDLQAAVSELDSEKVANGFTAPVVYASGIALNSVTKTVTYNNQIYCPTAAALAAAGGTITTTNWVTDSSKFQKIDGVSAQLVASSGSSLVGYTPAGTGAVARDVQSKLRESVSVKDFGAVGDGVVDDTAAINAAIAAVGAAGGGAVFFPGGTYRVSNSNPAATSWDNKVAIWVKANNVHLLGAGRKSTKIVLSNNSGAHVIKFGQRIDALVTVQCASVRGMEIDGNRANQSVPTALLDHWNGIDVAAGCQEIILEDLNVHDTTYYGIGFQTDNFKNCLIENVVVSFTGADGIDCKDDNGTSRGNRINNVTVRSFGLVSSAILPTQAGINVRSGFSVSNVEVTDFSGDRHGIRFDNNLTTPSIYKAALSNFLVIASDKNTSIGVFVNSIPVYYENVIITGGKVIGANIGIDSRAEYVQINTVKAIDCGTGLQVFRSNQVTNFSARSCTVAGYVIRNDNNILTNISAFNCLLGANVEADADNTQMRHGVFQGNTTAITDSGTQTGISEINGIRTNSVTSGTFAVDSTGVKSVTIDHNLDFTPDIGNITLTVSRNTNVSDYAIDLLRVNVATASQVACTVRVSVASGFSGAVADLQVRSFAKKALRY